MQTHVSLLAHSCLRYGWLGLTFILALGLGAPAVVCGQTIEWDKTIGTAEQDDFSIVRQVNDGGYILGGQTVVLSGRDEISGDDVYTFDFMVAKLDAAGQKEWSKIIGGNSNDYLTALQPTHDGGYILGGFSYSKRGRDKTGPKRGGRDYWVIKLDAGGQKVWDKTIGGNRDDYLVSLQQTHDGGYILGGYSNSNISGDKTQPSKGLNDYWVVKLDAAGRKEWDKTIGGQAKDILFALELTSDGGYILGGSSYSDISGDKTKANKGENDLWLVKLNADGTKAWDETIGTYYNEYSIVYYNSALQQTRDGGYIVGISSSAGISGDKTEANKGIYGSEDYWIIKLDAAGRKQWDRTIGGNNVDVLTSLQQTTDGGYILGGASYSNSSGDKTEDTDYVDYWLVKVDINGWKEWDKTIGGDGSDFLRSLQQTTDGGFILSGESDSDISGDKTEYSGNSDLWVVKLKKTPPPTSSWNVRFGGARRDNFAEVIKTADGGYLAGGYSVSYNSGDKSQRSQGGYDYWVVKTNVYGTKLWEQRYGGDQHDYLNSIIQTADGGYLLGGSSWSGAGGDKTEGTRGDRDYWVVKISATGEKQWDKRYGGSGFEDLKKLVPLATGEYILAGYSNSPANGDKSQPSQGGTDYWVIKISATGEKIWDKRYGGALNDDLYALVPTSDGGFLLGGSSASGLSGDKSQFSQGDLDYWLVRTDNAGNQLWDKTYGGTGSDELFAMGQTATGEFFVAGHSASAVGGDKSYPSQGGTDFWLLQLRNTGEKLWDKTYGGDQNETLRAVVQTTDGGFLLGGSSASGISGQKTQASRGSSDYWLVKTDGNGNLQTDSRFGGAAAEELRTVLPTADGGGYLLGGRSFSGISGDRTQPSQGGRDYWLIKLPATTENTASAPARVAFSQEPEPAEKSDLLTISPNPFRDYVRVQFTLTRPTPVTVRVYDLLGREVATLYQAVASANQRQAVEWRPGAQQLTGVYLLKISTPAKTTTQKIVFNR